jgi:hypothetical protein
MSSTNKGTNKGRDIERRITRPDYLSSFFCAAEARYDLYDLDLFAGTGVLDKVPDVDGALGAGAGAQAPLFMTSACREITEDPSPIHLHILRVDVSAHARPLDDASSTPHRLWLWPSRDDCH